MPIPEVTARFVALALLATASPASAFSWLIKHNYAACGACHADPSGGGVLTPYGRAQTELLLEARYGEPRPEGEVSPTTGPFLGLVKAPDWALLGFELRGGTIYTQTRNPLLTTQPPPVLRPIQMLNDLMAGISAGIFRASASLGFAHRRAEAASLTPTAPGGRNNVVSRYHWLGVSLLDDALAIRAGRMNLPFGIRTVEHSLWVRELTRTNINDQQQHGVAVSYAGETFRAELMGIAGNFQLKPDYYRERGYSGFVEWLPQPNLAVGASSLLTAARLDTNGIDAWPVRQAHGLLVRYGPSPQVALAAEADLLLQSAQDLPLTPGYAAWAQIDWEPWRGLHGIASVEAQSVSPDAGGSSLGAWVGVAWFATRAVEIRGDLSYRILPIPGAQPFTQLTYTGQLHLYL